MQRPASIPIVPNGLRYWVLPDEKPEIAIKVGDVVLSGDNNADKVPPLQGRIVAVGDAENDIITGARACKYERGELVVFGKYAGVPHTFEGVDYTVLAEDEILGRIIETPFDPKDPTDLTQM